MTNSTSSTTFDWNVLLLYAVGALLALAVVIDVLQGDGFDWLLAGAAVLTIGATALYQRKQKQQG